MERQVADCVFLRSPPPSEVSVELRWKKKKKKKKERNTTTHGTRMVHLPHGKKKREEGDWNACLAAARDKRASDLFDHRPRARSCGYSLSRLSFAFYVSTLFGYSVPSLRPVPLHDRLHIPTGGWFISLLLLVHRHYSSVFLLSSLRFFFGLNGPAV